MIKSNSLEDLEYLNSPSCFISYSWEDESHNNWVRKIAEDLQENGVVVFLDQWDLKPGDDLPGYMEVKIRDCDHSILICTPIFADKANSGKGGVGYEKMIVTGEIYQGIAAPGKFIPILRRGDSTESMPSYLKTKVYIDYRNDGEYDVSFEKLLRHLHKTPKYERPPLGQKPLFEKAEVYEGKSSFNGVEEGEAKKQSQDELNALFWEVYDFAFNKSKLNMSEEDAEQFANDWLEQYSDTDFNEFKRLYEYAWSPSGLDKTVRESFNYALKRIKSLRKSA